MATTSHDWRVTAYLEAKRAVAAFDSANEEDPTTAEAPLLSRAEILDSYWSGAQAAAAAAGALVAAELQAGMTWRDVALALGFTDVATARQALGPALAAGADRLRQRLPDA